MLKYFAIFVLVISRNYAIAYALPTIPCTSFNEQRVIWWTKSKYFELTFHFNNNIVQSYVLIERVFTQMIFVSHVEPFSNWKILVLMVIYRLILSIDFSIILELFVLVFGSFIESHVVEKVLLWLRL